MSQSKVQSPPEIVIRPTPRSCLSGSQLGAGEQRGRVDQIVEIVDDDRAMLLEERVPRRGGAGELAGVGDDVFLARSVRPARRTSTLLPLAIARSRAAAKRSGSFGAASK